MNGTPILLCQNLTFRSGSAAALVLPWTHFPAEFEVADLVVEVKLVEDAPLDAVLQASTDTTQPTEIARVTLTAVDVTTFTITSHLRQLVRLVLESDDAAGMVVSAWLLPKSGIGSQTPTGTIIMWGGNSANPPSGWLICDGAAVSRATYANLFQVFGTTFGPGDGSTTFNLPDFEGNFPRGAVGDGERGQTGGSVTPAVSVTNPTHVHAGGGLVTLSSVAVQSGSGTTVSAAATFLGGNSDATAQNSSASISDGRPPYLSIHFLAKT